MTKYEKKILNGLIHEILLRRDKVCLKCGNPQFQASHIYPKGRYRKMEFDPDNIKALCYNCHLNWWHKNALEASDWIKTVLPKKRLDNLKLRSQTSGDGTRNFKVLKMFLETEIKKYERN